MTFALVLMTAQVMAATTNFGPSSIFSSAFACDFEANVIEVPMDTGVDTGVVMIIGGKTNSYYMM